MNAHASMAKLGSIMQVAYVPADFEMGRVYLPLEDLDHLGVRQDELRGPLTAPLREVLESTAARAWRFYEEGAALVGEVDADQPHGRPATDQIRCHVLPVRGHGQAQARRAGGCEMPEWAYRGADDSPRSHRTQGLPH